MQALGHIQSSRSFWMYAVEKGARFRVVYRYGEQVVDLMAWMHDEPFTRLEKWCTAYNSYHISGVQPSIGKCLWSNADRPLLRVTADTVKVHDMTLMACFPSLYEKKGLGGRRSCAENILEAMQRFGIDNMLEIVEPFNIFHNTPKYSLKRLGNSKPDVYIEFEALEDLVCAVSCCLYDVDGFNGGEITDIEVVIAKGNKEPIRG